LVCLGVTVIGSWLGMYIILRENKNNTHQNKTS
jgi:hypothetical protein